jgi:hypothetical protein
MMNYGDTCHLRIALKLNIEIGNLSEQNCFCVFTYCGFRFKCETHHGKSQNPKPKIRCCMGLSGIYWFILSWDSNCSITWGIHYMFPWGSWGSRNAKNMMMARKTIGICMGIYWFITHHWLEGFGNGFCGQESQWAGFIVYTFRWYLDLLSYLHFLKGKQMDNWWLSSLYKCDHAHNFLPSCFKLACCNLTPLNPSPTKKIML